MKQYLHITRLLPVVAAALTVAGQFGSPSAATAQSIFPVPFVTTIAGLAAGSGNTLCTTGYKNIAGVNTGDGCLPTQAQLLTIYDVQVDAAGNVYTSENGSNNDIRVIYQGGATLGGMLTVANSAISGFTLTPGRIYTLAGGLNASITTKSGSSYLCGNIAGGIVALDSTGNGCPAAQSYIKPRGLAIDQYGNVFTTSNGSGEYIRVIYAGGATVANLIAKANPTLVGLPKPGYIYKIAGTSATAYAGDGGQAVSANFVSLRYLAVDSNGNIYASDGTTGSPGVEAAANNIRMINGSTGVVTTIVGEGSGYSAGYNSGYAGTPTSSATTACETGAGVSAYSAGTGCPYGTPGNNVPAAGQLLNTPYTLFVDAANNLYVTDYYNSVLRVIYMTAGSTVMGLGSNLTVGNIYTVAGGGAATVTSPNTPATSVKFANLYVAGIDHAGNIYAEDGTSKLLWRFDAKTALGTVIGGGGGSATALPKACGTGETQTFLDTLGDGCPATQAPLSETGTISFDPQGNLYLAENGNGVVREMSFNNLYPATAVGSSVVQTQAFEVATAVGVPAVTNTLMGTPTTDYSSTVGSPCSASGAQTGYAICLANITFAPRHDGQRPGSLVLTGTGSILTGDLSGIGIASDIAIDAGTQSTIGTGLSPAGVAADTNGNVFVADTTSNSVFKGSSTGTTLTSFVTGLTSPSGLALDGQGNLYIANTGKNVIAEVSSTGTAIATLGTGLSAPKGIAVDGLGDVYVADTGNNRIVQVFANGNQITVPVNASLTVALSAPTQLALDASGNLFIVDSGNGRIVKYSGSAGATIITLDAGVVPTAVAVDPAGDVYVTDSAGKQLLVYDVGATAGDILVTGLGNPLALAADPDANLFIADSSKAGAFQLRRSLGNIVLPLASVTVSGAQTTVQSITVNNVGNASLTFPSLPLTSLSGTNPAQFSVAPSTTNGCSASVGYLAGAACNFTASFTPLGTGSYMATVNFNTNATNTGTATASLNGTGKFLITTNTTINITSPAGGAPYYFGQNFTLTAGLTPSSLIVNDGSEKFTYTVDGKSQQPVNTSQTTLSLPSPTVGNHSVSVTYNSDGNYATSSANIGWTVLPAVTTTTLTVTPVNTGGVLTLSFTATVTSPTATGEPGTVSFYSATTPVPILLATLPIGANGVTTYSSGTLSYGTNSFYAVYTPAPTNGTTNFTSSTSSTVTPASDFIVGIPATTASISQGGVATLGYNVAPVFGGTGTVTLSCTGLPANSVCRFAPMSFTLSGSVQQESVLIYTDVSSTLASNEQPHPATTVLLVLGLPFGLGLLLIRRRPALSLLGVAIVAMAAVTGVTGCGKNSISNPNLTPPGTYSVGIVFTGSNGFTTSHTATVALTVIQDSGPF
jgi:sugar lactone lactonase YvrE